MNIKMVCGGGLGDTPIDLSECTYASNASWASGTAWEITVTKKPRAVFFSYTAGGAYGYYLFTADDNTHAFAQQSNSTIGLVTISSTFTDSKVTLNRQGTAAYNALACVIY